ncbi:hypothetical protein ACTJJB_30870 [Chitinophaga sp. 22536]|uniref:hypothetical protein n=1 Tax=unclassified Chitinophaga TaxID=2619133 RepID=UPI003F855AD7
MTEHQKKDAILNFLFERKGRGCQSNVAVDKLGITEDEILKFINVINSEKGAWIEAVKGGIHYKKIIKLFHQESHNVERFLNEGGYVRCAIKVASANEMNEKNAKDVQRRAVRAEIISVISALAAVAAAVAAIYSN